MNDLSSMRKLVSMELKKIWSALTPFFSNKYTLTVFVVLAWMTFFDDNSLLRRVQSVREMHALEAEVLEYTRQIEQDRAMIKELRSGNDNLEKFAREQYLMCLPNEDVFIFED
jgi:cell division protein FtsB